MGLDVVVQAVDKIRTIQEHICATHDRQKSWADTNRRPLEFKVGEHVFLRISPTKRLIRFGACGKLSPRYIGPFEILERVGEVAYRLAAAITGRSAQCVSHVTTEKICQGREPNVGLFEIKIAAKFVMCRVTNCYNG